MGHATLHVSDARGRPSTSHLLWSVVLLPFADRTRTRPNCSVKATDTVLTFPRMSLSPHRENEVLLRLAGFRYLTRELTEEFLFAGLSLTPLSRQVITRRVLNRLKRKGLILETPRLVGPAGGTARLVYFPTAAGYKRARSLDSGLPSHRPGSRGTALIGHGLMCAEVALAFRRAARSHPGHEVLDWEYDWQAAQRLGPTPVVPDAHLAYSTSAWLLDAFIEVDLGTEGSRVFARKIEHYLDLYRDGGWRRYLEGFPVVLTVAPSAARAATLRGVTTTVVEGAFDRERIKTVTKFTFTTLADLLGPSGPLGAIWSVAGKSGLHPLFETELPGETPAPEAQLCR